MKSAHWDLPHTLGALRRSRFSEDKIGKRSIKDELRQNLIQCIRQKKPLFPGIVGYDDTVVPQIINAVLSRHNFILLGLRGQAKTRLIRMLTGMPFLSLPLVIWPICSRRPGPEIPRASTWGFSSFTRLRKRGVGRFR